MVKALRFSIVIMVIFIISITGTTLVANTANVGGETKSYSVDRGYKFPSHSCISIPADGEIAGMKPCLIEVHVGTDKQFYDGVFGPKTGVRICAIDGKGHSLDTFQRNTNYLPRILVYNPGCTFDTWIIGNNNDRWHMDFCNLDKQKAYLKFEKGFIFEEEMVGCNIEDNYFEFWFERNGFRYPVEVDFKTPNGSLVTAASGVIYQSEINETREAVMRTCKNTLRALGAAQLCYMDGNTMHDYGSWEALVHNGFIDNEERYNRSNMIEGYSIAVFVEKTSAQNGRISKKIKHNYMTKVQSTKSCFTIIARPDTKLFDNNTGYLKILGITEEQDVLECIGTIPEFRKWVSHPKADLFSLQDHVMWEPLR